MVTQSEVVEAGAPADLEIDVEITGRDFGESSPQLGGAIFSTLVWLTFGHFSWFINNREYPESEVNMYLTFRSVTALPEEGEDGAGAPKLDVTRYDLERVYVPLNELTHIPGGPEWLAARQDPWTQQASAT